MPATFGPPESIYNGVMARGRWWGVSAAVVAAILAGCGEPPSESDVIEAVAAGDVAKVKQLLASGGFVESRDKRGFTALGIACLNGEAKMAELLLEHRAGLQSAGSAPEPIGLAVQSGSIETVKVLLDHNATPNGGGLKPAPIGLATSVEMAQLLLSKGADPNGLKEAISDPPLILAVRRGQLSVVRFLLEHGAKVDAVTKQGQTALHIACVARNGAILNKGEDGTLELIKVLLKAGANPQAVDALGNQPIHYVARNGLSTLDAVLALAAAKAPLKVLNNDNETPLMICLKIGRRESDPIVKYLREKTGDDFRIGGNKPSDEEMLPDLGPHGGNAKGSPHSRNTPE